MSKKRVIVHTKLDSKGRIFSVLFAGNIHYTDIETAKRMAVRDQIENVHIVNGKTGPFIRSNPNKDEGDNLSEMGKKSRRRKRR